MIPIPYRTFLRQAICLQIEQALIAEQLNNLRKRKTSYGFIRVKVGDCIKMRKPGIILRLLVCCGR